MKDNKTKVLVGFIAVILLLSSCASTAKGKVTKCEPTGDDSVLLVGRVGVNIKNSASRTNVKMDGSSRKGVKILVEEIETKKKFQVLTDKNGIFYVPKAKAGYHYKVNEVSYKVEANEGAFNIIFEVGNDTTKLCEANQATIFVNMILDVDMKEKFYKWYQQNAWEIKQHFKKSYPDSEWNNYL